MHELRTGHFSMADPDKTKPPTRVEELWGVLPPGVAVPATPRRRSRPQPRSASLGSRESLTLYRAARDCMMAGAYTGAVALLRRLILHVTVEKGNEAGTQEDAEHLLAVAESLMGLPGGPDKPSDA